MRVLVHFILSTILVGCAQDSQTAGVVYAGRANLNAKLHQFTAVNAETEKSVTLTKTGPRELTFNLNDKISHIDYETDVIIVRSEIDSSAWTATRVRGGFQLEDGTKLKYGDCKGWGICVMDSGTEEPILKGKYTLSGNSVAITLWISESEKHVELLGLMANALFNKSINAKQSNESALETLSSQVWTY
jgi:hypothetical protein